MALTGHPGQIAGTVDVGDVTAPVTTTVVARAVWPPEGEEITAETVVAADGSYTLADLPAPGSYELTFTAEGYAPTTITERITGGQQRFAPHVRLGAGAGQISGTVTDGSTPIGGVTVTTTVGEAEVTVGTPTVGQVGAFLIPGLPTPGTYVLTFEMDGYTPATVVVDLAAGESRTDLAVNLRGGAGTVTGKVTGADGGGLGGVTVTAGGAETAVEATTLTSGDVGAFTLAGLPPGAYTLTFSLAGYQSVSVPVDLTDGPPAPVRVTLRPALGRIDGVVTSGGTGAGGRRGPGHRRPPGVDHHHDHPPGHGRAAGEAGLLPLRRPAAGHVHRLRRPGRPGRGHRPGAGERGQDVPAGPGPGGLRCASRSNRAA